MTNSPRETEFEWFVANEYKVEGGRLYTDRGAQWHPYYPADVVDLPSKFIEVLHGEPAVRQFALRYGFMGYSKDFVFTVQDYRGFEDSRSFEEWLDEVGTGGEDISSIYADATTVLAIKHAGAFLKEPDAMRQGWRRFIREHWNDVVTYGLKRYSRLIETPVTAESVSPVRPENQLFHRYGADEVKARILIAVLLEGNLKRALFPRFRVHGDGRPEMNLQFESLIHFIYWRLFEEMASSFTRICPCGKIFQTQNALQRHCDALCTNRMNQRRFRERNRRDGQKGQ